MAACVDLPNITQVWNLKSINTGVWTRNLTIFNVFRPICLFQPTLIYFDFIYGKLTEAGLPFGLNDFDVKEEQGKSNQQVLIRPNATRFAASTLL